MERVHTAQGRVHTAQGGVHTAQERVHTAQGRVHTAQGGVHTAQERAHTAQGRVHTAQGGVHTAQGQVHTAQGRVHILLLQTCFVTSGLAIAWFHSYLEGRSQFVRIGCTTSPVTLCTTDVPQGSVLGPMLFSLFISPIAHIVGSYDLLQQQYADNTQLCRHIQR